MRAAPHPRGHHPLEADFSLDPIQYHGRKETIVIANPNAPTGLALPPEAIGAIADANPDNVVIVDEAYVDFGAQSCVPLIASHDNLLVVQTFSKSRQMAGARLGLTMGNRELIADMERVRSSLNPYNINRMTLAAGIAALESTGYFNETRHQIMETRAWTAGELARRGFELTHSQTNFLFARTDRMEGGPSIRPCGTKGCWSATSAPPGFPTGCGLRWAPWSRWKRC